MKRAVTLIAFSIFSVMMVGCTKETEKVEAVEPKIEIAGKEIKYSIAEATTIPTATPVPTQEIVSEITEVPTEEITEQVQEYEITDITENTEEVVQSDYIDDSTSNMTYLGEYTVTFYCPCPEHCNGTLTASGQEGIPWGSVACADLPFGTTVYIEGLGEFTVLDRGVGSGCMDIFVGYHDEIPEYGMTTASTYILN